MTPNVVRCFYYAAYALYKGHILSIPVNIRSGVPHLNVDDVGPPLHCILPSNKRRRLYRILT